MSSTPPTTNQPPEQNGHLHRRRTRSHRIRNTVHIPPLPDLMTIHYMLFGSVQHIIQPEVSFLELIHMTPASMPVSLLARHRVGPDPVNRLQMIPIPETINSWRRRNWETNHNPLISSSLERASLGLHPRMTAIAWNPMGAATQGFDNEARDLIVDHDPDMMLIFETRSEGPTARSIATRLRFGGMRLVDAVSDGGGFWMLWHPTRIVVETTYASDGVVHSLIRAIPSDVEGTPRLP